MNDALFVGCLECVGDLASNGEGVGNRHRPARDERRQVLALDELHHERADTADSSRPWMCRDVGVVERRQGLGFAGESRDALCIGGEHLRQDLDCDAAIELRVSRAVHLAHAARSEGSDDFVRAESSARCETH